MGLLMLLAWRIFRADVWPAWAAALLGLANDILSGYPLGQSVALWPLFMLAMDVVDRRTMWRDWRLEWVIGAGFVAINELIEWRIVSAAGAPVRFALVWPAILVSILSFPVASVIAHGLDRWRENR
jgi:rod shape-determining protein MreD